MHAPPSKKTAPPAATGKGATPSNGGTQAAHAPAAVSPASSLPAQGPAQTHKSTVHRDDRIPFNTKLRFESDDSAFVIQGTTTDVSMSGAFLNSDHLPPGVQEGMEGVVFLEMSKGGNTFEVSFHCSVARVTPKGLGLNFENEVE
ncbi:MAG: PilZ domain-containing protein [Magnetococcales bacterium]|nr:PilZ domain-containing protein [Magnetococcales bacterium]